MPLERHLAENGLEILDEFRESNERASKGLLEALKECEGRISLGKKIRRFRSDSAAYQAANINHCEDDQIKYTISMDQDNAVKKAMDAIPDEDREALKGRREDWIAQDIYLPFKQA